ncbi:sensor histidine kinase [Desulfonatronum thiodismutans]|uniref:sensor histidine kinase n=1 Tax=Desulfonatronum thiodismutans TaxID=159290 RepID=UPI0006902B37|nr:ATP-binding protein [Desulfonatronum thiodismutans]
MSTTDNLARKKNKLRKQAEARMAEASGPVESLSPDQMKNLIHEYQVHQIELELQNEELRATQQRLGQIKNRYAELFNNAPVGYLIVDAKGVITKANETFARMIGGEGHDFADRLLTELVVHGDRPALLGRFKAFFKNPKGKQLDFRLQGISDEFSVRCVGRREVLSDSRPTPDEHRHLLLAVSDVSAQVRVERRQRLLAKTLEILNHSVEFPNAVNQILDNVLQETGVDAVGIRLRKGDDYPYYVHIGFSSDFLRTENSLLVRDAQGKVCRDADGRPSLECTCGLVLGGRTDTSNPLFTPNGSWWTNDAQQLLDLPTSQDTRTHPRNTCLHHGYQSMALIPVRANQEIIGLLQLNDRRKGFLDLDLIQFLEKFSDSIGVALIRVQNEDEVRRYSSELKALLAEKDKFFSIIAHDLKSPLSGLLALSRMFAEEAEHMTMKELQEVASTMCKSTERLHALLENLLHWSLVQQGLMSFSPKPLNLHELVSGSIESLRSVAELKRITIQNTIPEKLEIMADQSMITTVVRNFVSNALKYSSSGGSVTISGFQNGDMVEVAVRDTGTGLDQQTQAHLFVLDRKTTRPGTQGEHGTGLGLILCKEFIEKHGGEIRVESEVGQGTVFYFTLPAGE